MRKRQCTLVLVSNFLCLFLLCIPFKSRSQLTNFQTVTKKCYTGPTVAIGSAPTGTSIGNVFFNPGADIPVGHKVTDVIVEIVWSKTDNGSCTMTTGTIPDQSHVGFKIRGPVGLPRYLAASAFSGPLSTLPTTSSWTGLGNINRDTVVFKDGHPSLLPAGMPVPGIDTVSPNNEPLSFYCGKDPYGLWSVEVIHDDPGTGSRLCLHSYCITLITCDNTTLKASCKATTTVFLNAIGTKTFQFSDLDSISDVSCRVKDITFSPATVNCAQSGMTIPVTMTIQDHLDSIRFCTSLVSVRDNTKPVFTNCFPATWSTRYLNAIGKDTIWAADVNVVTDNCLPIVKQVRPFIGGTWGPFVVLSCVTGSQQFRIKATDLSGNNDSCRVIVMMRDTFPPTALCGSTTAYLTTSTNGAVTVPEISLDAGSFDICPPITGRWIGSQFAPPPVYTCADIGKDTVRLIVSDASGNLDTCDNAIVTIVDTIKPTAICQHDTIYLNSSGLGYVYATDINNNSTDVCGIDSVNINGSASLTFNCVHVNAAQPVTLRVFDKSGNNSSCMAMVTVRDTFPPIANCRNVTRYLNTSGTVTVLATNLNNSSLDLCTGTNLTFQIAGNPSINFSCANIATNPNAVTLTVIDSFGNASTCTSLVTVLDSIKPKALCATPTVYLNNAGIATVTATVLNASSTDNCAITNRYVNTIGTSFTNFNCNAIFTPQTATLIVEDAMMNRDTCWTTVTVVDTIRPNALCKASVIVQLNASGIATVLPAAIDSNSVDNCGLVQYRINGLSSVTYTCANLGTQTATLSVRDSSNNTRSCLSQIIVQDNIAPIASCQTTTSYLNASGTATVVPSDVLVFPATSDNCGIASTSFTSGPSVTFDCDSVGSRTVTVLVTDNYGNTSSCLSTVTVLDTISPAANCRPVPFTVQLSPTGVGFVTALDIDNGSTDLCGLDTMLVNSVDSFFFNCTNLGSTIVTLSVLDESNNQSTCQATVIVQDAINPTALCQNKTVYLGPTGLAMVTPTDINAGSSDNCTFAMTINGLAAVNYNCSQIGTNTAQLIVTDGSGNVNQCNATITVLDTIKPVANCIGAATRQVYLNSSCFATLAATALNNGSTDNCALASSAFTIAGFPNATFTASNLLTNPNSLTLRVTDASGNFTTCLTSVIVRDTIKPNVLCKPDTVQLGLTGTVSVTPSMVHLSSNDNCTGGLSYTINGQSSITYNCSNLGSNSVTLTARDSSNNSNFCVTTVFVRDLIAPVASCRPTQTLGLISGTSIGVLTPAQVNLGSSDNCSIVSFSLSQDTFSCADIFINPHTVTMVVVDANGNKDSCTSQITVRDNTPPTAACQTATVYLGAGTVTVTPATVLVAPTGDNCPSYTTTFAGAGSSIIYTCDSIGLHNVGVVVTDISGNTASCVTSITVVDSLKPTAICRTTPYTVQLDASGNGCVTPLNVDNGSSDFCGISAMYVNGLASLCYTCANVGNTAVTLSVLDASGNQSTCTANIIVNDPINPVALCHDTTLYLSPSGLVTVTPAQINAGSSDNCSFTMTINGLSAVNYNCSNSGTNTAQLIITDISGNITQCAANVTILDTVPPTANCVGLNVVRVYLNSTCFATIPASTFNNGSVDNCSSTLNYFVNGLPNAVFNATNVTTNPNPITLVVRDATGNTSTCTTNAIVIDTFPPVVTCKIDTVQLVGVNAVVTPPMINAGSSDNCSAPNLTVNGQPFVTLTCADLGLNAVTLIATDISGNVDSCITTVLLEDVAAPTANCKLTYTKALDPSNNLAILQASNLNNGSLDNCSIVTYQLSKDTFDCNDVYLSPHVVTLVVIDQSGNRDSCITQVTIQDTIAPTALCANDTLYFSGATVNITAASVNAASFDNCLMGTTMSISQDTFNCPDIGVNNIMLTVSDSSGNIGTCIALITILDSTATAIAGPMQVLCSIDSTTLAATPVPSSLIGTWTTSSGATIANPNSPTTQITNVPPGANVFYWVLSNSTCAYLSGDSVVINMLLPSPDIAAAGLDQNLCQDTIIYLATAPLTTSTGLWTQSTAQANAGVSLVNPSDTTCSILGTVAGNSYTFVWELTNGLCGIHSTDTIVVTIDYIPNDIAAAGLDVTCSPAVIAMNAAVPTQSIGLWATPTTATIDVPNSPTTVVSSLTQDTTMMVWSLSNGACVNYSRDTMYIILDDIWPIARHDSISVVPNGIITTVDVIPNDNLPPNWDIFIHTPMTEGQMASLGNGQFSIDINGVNLNQYFIYEICNSDCPIVCDTALVTIAIQPPGDCYTPNAFTPNNDGNNDYFTIPCLSNTTDRGHLVIFNRWGNLVYETTHYENNWNGTHNNQELPDGVYFYILQIEGKSPQQGSIELRR